MKVITKNPIIINGRLFSENYSNGGGVEKLAEKIAEKYGDENIETRKATEQEKGEALGVPAKKERTGFFSKGSRDARQTYRQGRQKERKDDRIATRTERKANRIKKYGARPLNPFTKLGKKFWQDRLPKLKKKADGNYEKTLPDGSKQDVPKEQVQIIPPPAGSKSVEPIAVDKKDLNTPQEVVTQVVGDTLQVSKNYVEGQVEKVLDGGVETVYKKADVVDEGSSEAKKPMSKTTIALLVGGGLLVLVAGYFIYKNKKK